MIPRLVRITINSNQPELLVRFYTLLGMVFQKKAVEKGSQVWRGECQGHEFEIFGIQESFTAKAPTVQLSFSVSDIQTVVEKLRPLGVQIMMEPLQTKTGFVSYLMDPDGRSIELLQNL